MQLCKFIFPRGREHEGLVCSAHSVFSATGVLCLFLKAIFGKRGNDRHFCHFFWETGLTPAVHSLLIFPQTDDLGLPSSSDRLHRVSSFFFMLYLKEMTIQNDSTFYIVLAVFCSTPGLKLNMAEKASMILV